MKLKWTTEDRLMALGPGIRGVQMKRVQEAKYKGYIACITAENGVAIFNDPNTPAAYGPQSVHINVQTNGRESAMEFATSILKALVKANS